jgi:hypothetical protein
LKEADIFKYAPFGYTYMIKQLAAYKYRKSHPGRQRGGVHGQAILRAHYKNIWQGFARDRKIGFSALKTLQNINEADIRKSIMQVAGPGSAAIYSYRIPFDIELNRGEPALRYDLNTTLELSAEEDGRTTSEFLPAFTPEHLTYFVFSYIDMRRLLADIGLEQEFNFSEPPLGVSLPFTALEDTSDLLELTSLSGQVTTKTLFSKGKLNTGSVILYNDAALDRGSIYVGPAHQTVNGSWMTGQARSGSSRRLFHRNVFDTRIQDRRGTQKFKRFVNQTLKGPALSLMSKSLTKKSAKYNNFYKHSYTPKPSYFSDIWLSFDRFNNHMFMFQFNFNQAVRENCAYPVIFDRLPQAIQEYSRIRRVDVFRRRVKEHSETLKNQIEMQQKSTAREPIDSFGESGLTPWDRNNPTEEHVVRSMSDVVVSVTVPSGSVARNTLRKVNWSPGSGIFTYTGVDGELKDKGYGNYQYVVEIETEDGSVNYLLDALRELTEARTDLNMFYKLATIKGNFNYATNRFSTRMRDRNALNYSRRAKRAITSITNYFEVITGFSLNSFFSSNGDAVELLQNAVDLNSGGPPGILNVIEIIDQIIMILKSATEISTSTKTTKAINRPADGTIQLKNHSLRTFKIRKYFNNDIATPLHALMPGIEYIAPESDWPKINRPLGTTAVDIGQYIRRTQQETDRYFNTAGSFSIDNPDGRSTTSDTAETTRYTFLSPTVIRTPGPPGQPNRAFSTEAFKDNDMAIDCFSSIMASLPSNSMSVFPMSSLGLADTSSENVFFSEDQRSNMRISNSIANFLSAEADTDITILNVETSRTPWRNEQAFSSIGANRALIDNFFNKGLNTCFSVPKEIKRGAPAITFDSTLGDVRDELDANLFSVNLIANIASPRFFHTRIEIEDTPARAGTTPLFSFEAHSPIQGLKDITSIKDMPKANISAKIKALPNQIKSLIVSAQGNSEVLTPESDRFNRVTSGNSTIDAYSNPNNLLDTYFNHLSLVKVQILVRLTVMGRSIGTSRAWVDFTREHLDTIVNSEKEYICRLVPYDLPEFQVNHSKKFNLVIYNKYFILRSSNFSLPRTVTKNIASLGRQRPRKNENQRATVEQSFLRDNLNVANSSMSAPESQRSTLGGRLRLPIEPTTSTGGGSQGTGGMY